MFANVLATIGRVVALSLIGAAGWAMAQKPPLAPSAPVMSAAAPAQPLAADMTGLTIARLAILQRQALELEAAKKAGLIPADGSTSAPEQKTAPAMLQAPKPLRLVKLLSVISVKGAVRYIEVEEGGVVRTASVGELVGGWKIAAATPDGIRLISSKSVAVELKPGESMEVK